jgi:outer membrane protein assembly factor BamE
LVIAELAPGADARFRYDITFHPVQIQPHVSRNLILVAPLLIAACAPLPALTPYRIEIQQGNYVTQEMLAQLKPGLTRDQVRFVLGTPLLSDIFHGERWDYVFMRRRANSAEVEYRRLAVFFEDGKLKQVKGDRVVAAGAVDSPKGTEQ